MISADLGQQLESFVAQLVAAGRYNSKSEVLREGVRLVQDREARLAALDASIARGIADADATRIGPEQSGNGVDDRGFSGPRPAEQRRHPCRRFERYVKRETGEPVGKANGEAHDPEILRAT